MAKKVKPSFAKASEGKTKKDIEQIKDDLEKTGKDLGDLFKGIFKGVGKILDVVGEMEKEGEQTRMYQKKIKGVTKEGKEFQGEAGWKISTGILKHTKKKK